MSILTIGRSFFATLILLATAAAQSTAPAYYFTTLAGAVHHTSFDGTCLTARFNAPNGTALDAAGNVYVADSGNHTIRKVTPAGVVTTLAGLAGIPGSSDGVGSAARFYNPQAVAVDATGNVFVADGGNFTIRKITPAGVVTTLAGLAGHNGDVDGTGSAARFLIPGKTALVIDHSGNLYLADGKIRKITPAGVVSTFITPDATFSYLNVTRTVGDSFTLGIDGADNLYTNGANAGDLGAIKITPAGIASAAAPNGASVIEGLAADPAGHVYVALSYENYVQTLMRDGKIITGNNDYRLATYSRDGASGNLGTPTGLSVDSADNAYFADLNTSNIRVVDPSGVISTLAGETDYGVLDGAGAIARFDRPAGIAVDASGNVYVADLASSTIRKVTPTGTVSTIAGTAYATGSTDGNGPAARFNLPTSVALDSTGNLLVADYGNHTIRKISPGGDVTTLAGLAGQSGAADGAGNLARFNSPSGLVVDVSGTIFVCDSGNQIIRQITPAGIVSTLAGAVVSGTSTRLDGTGASARFANPWSICADGTGNLYVTESPLSIGGALRKITAAGVVSTVHFGTNDKNYPNYPLVAANQATGDVLITSNGVTTEIKPNGETITLSATNGIPFILPPAHSTTSGPLRYGGLAVTPDGVVYYADGLGTIRQAIRLTQPGASLSFTTQSADSTINEGDTLALSASVSGTQPIAYQWLKEGAEIPGANSSTLTITGAVGGNGGVYTLSAQNATGRILSNAITVAVLAKPQIIQEINKPLEYLHHTVSAGASISLSVVARGSPPPDFQWRKDSLNLSGVSGTTWPQYNSSIPGFNNALTLDNLATRDTGDYSVLVSNAAGSVSSIPFSLVVTPRIGTQPSDRTVPADSDVTFSVVASGAPTLNYQWQKGGVNLAGATSSTLTLTSVTVADAGSYQVVISDPAIAASTVTSKSVTLTLTTSQSAPTISGQPEDWTTYGYAPQANAFQVVADGSPNNFTYQWMKDGVAIAGATSSGLSFGKLVATDVGTYSVTVTNSVGSVTSRNAALTLVKGAGVIDSTSYPAIVTAPASQSAPPGASVSFSVNATGSPSPTYQWQKNGGNITGATTSMLTLPNVTANDAATYTVLVALPVPNPISGDSYGGVTARSATLTVTGTLPSSPPSKTVTTGHGTSFSAGGTTGSIQWQISTNNGTSWSNLTDSSIYSGTTTSTLTITTADSTLNAAQYRYVATNNGVSLPSSAATLTVAPAFFPYPTAVAVDSQGNLFVADAHANTIQKVSTSGQVALIAGTNGTAGSSDGTGSSARFNQPGGLQLTSSGALFVTDTANGTIRSITTSGTVTTFAGTSGTRGSTDGSGSAASFSAPTGVAVDGNGNLFITDAMNNTVRKITPAGIVTTLAGTATVPGSVDATGGSARFNFPTGIAIDGNGNLFVADTTNNIIRKISSAGTVSTLAGLAGVSGSTDGDGVNALFNHPGGLAIDGGGNLFVADTGNSTIRRISPSGNVTTFAGLPGIAGLQDGVGSQAFLNQPQALGFGSDGNLYVADTGNAALRKISSTVSVTTLTLTAAPTGDGTAPSGSTGTSGTGTTGTGSSSGQSTTPSSSGGGGSLGALFTLLLAALGAARTLMVAPRKN